VRPDTKIKRAIASPVLVARKINKLYFAAVGQNDFNTNGVDIFEKEWDNLIILDACRYDLFKQQTHISGNLEKEISRGSSTTEFLAGNFAGRRLHDVVYVTANPQFHRHQDTINCELHNVINVWKDSGWDSENETVLPETVTDQAVEAANEYSNKRLIIHYIQPHYPFLDSGTSFDKGQLDDPDDDSAFWRRIMTGELSVDIDHLWNLYESNLNKALDSTSNLLQELEGKTVITSDHGNMMGDRSFPIPIREWGHPRGVHTPELVEVPWLDCGGKRREIVAEPPAGQTQESIDSVNDRLRNLGYVQ